MNNKKTSPNNHMMLEVNNLTKQFETVLAVDRVSFQVESGEVFGLLGPNGAGKTTTVRMLSALIAPTSGSARVAGFQTGDEDQEIRRRVGILTESPGLYDNLSAERNLGFFAELYEVQEVQNQVESYLKMLGLWERRHEKVSTFSKGMRQKLAIARALLHEPEVLFLDEPTSGLDPEMARLVRSFISDLKSQGRTIVLCTHNLDEAERLCDRVAVIRGQLLAMDTPSALRRQLYGRTAVFHLGSPAHIFQNSLKNLSFIQSLQPMDNKLVIRMDDLETNNPQVVRALVNAGADIQFVGELRQSLEDVYLQLVNKAREVEK